MSVHSRPSIQNQDGMELRDRKMTKDCTQPLRIGKIKPLVKKTFKLSYLVLSKSDRCTDLFSAHYVH